MVAGKHNFICEQGTDWSRVLTITASATSVARDISGFTARMKVRPYVDSATVMAELTTENGGITIDGPAGEITLVLTDTQTSDIDSDGEYDLEIISGAGAVERVIEGKFYLRKRVSR